MTFFTHDLAPFGGSLTSSQFPIPGIPGLGFFQAAGTPKGTAVFFHGLETAITASPLPPQSTAEQTWITDLLADNWSVLYPSHPEDGSATLTPNNAMLNAVTNDTFGGGGGAGYLETVLLEWDNIVCWCAKNSPGPILLLGFSEGGWYCLQVLKNKPLGVGNGEIIGSVLTNPATWWSNVNPLFGAFGAVSTVGMDTSPTQLNAVGSTPVLVGHSPLDNTVGYGGITTVAAGSNGVNVASFTGGSPGTLQVADASQMQDFGSGGFFGPSLRVATSAGYCIMEISGTISGNNVGGCITTFGSGTLSTGGTVGQSQTLEIISNAAGAGANVTGRTNDFAGHGFDATDVTAFMAFITANIDTRV